MTINKNITIQGNGPTGKVILDARGLSRIFTIYDNLNVIFINVTFINANSNSYGGAIYCQYNRTILTFINCTFNNNMAFRAGAIFSSGNTTIQDSIFTDNSALSTGGAIYLTGCQYSNITGCNFTNNTAVEHGGALFISNEYHSYSYINVTDSIFDNNAAVEHGGGIVIVAYPNSTAYVNIKDSTFKNNNATFGGGICVTIAVVGNYVGSNYVNITDSTFENNNADYGSGIYIPYSNLTNISGCQIINNNGDGITIGYNATVIIIENEINDNGGHGVNNDGNATINDNIINDNAGDGVKNTENGTADINNNDIIGNGGNGVTNDGNATIEDNRILDNFGNGVSNSGNVTIEDNSITGNLGDGVSNVGDADIVGNDIADNGGSGVINGENGTATINDNILSNNGGSGEIVNDGTAFGSGNVIYYQSKLSVTANVSSNRATVRVTAINNRGNVIVGRTISFYVNGDLVGTAVTDSNGIGEFVYTASSIGTFNVLASLEGFNESVTFGTSIYSATNITTAFNIANIPGNGGNNSTPFISEKQKPILDVEIEGDKIIATLTDEDGNPISGKKIVIRDRNGKIIRSGITNKNGQVIFRYAGNKVGLTVSFAGNDEFSGTDFKIKFDPYYSKNNKTSNKTTNNPAATAAMKNTGVLIISIILVLLSTLGVTIRKKQN